MANLKRRKHYRVAKRKAEGGNYSDQIVHNKKGLFLPKSYEKIVAMILLFIYFVGFIEGFIVGYILRKYV